MNDLPTRQKTKTTSLRASRAKMNAQWVAFWDRAPLLCALGAVVVIVPTAPWTLSQLDHAVMDFVLVPYTAYLVGGVVLAAALVTDGAQPPRPRDLGALAQKACQAVGAAGLFHMAGTMALWIDADTGQRYATHGFTVITLLTGVPTIAALCAAAYSCHWLWCNVHGDAETLIPAEAPPTTLEAKVLM